MRVSDIEGYAPKWLNATFLAETNKPITVTVHQVQVEELRQADGSHTPKIVLAFVGAKRRLPLNKTQAQSMIGICGSDKLQDWVGATIKLTVGRAPNGKGTIVISKGKKATDEPKTTDQAPVQPPSDGESKKAAD